MQKKLFAQNENNKKAIIFIKQNEYFIYNIKKENKNLIGFYTDAITTCSSLIISINDDHVVFFSHIDEESEILKIIHNEFIPELNKIEVDNIIIIYSIGIGPILNKKKEDNINELIKILESRYKCTKIIKNHKASISCLKLLNNNQNKILLGNLIEKQKQYFESGLLKNKMAEKFINDSITFFKESFLFDYNTIFYFDSNRLKKFSKIFDFSIIE